jgi:hypothetical protein
MQRLRFAEKEAALPLDCNIEILSGFVSRLLVYSAAFKLKVAMSTPP